MRDLQSFNTMSLNKVKRRETSILSIGK